MLRIIARYFIICLLFSSAVRATIFDNRYIPFLQRPYIVVPGRPSHVTANGFFATASNAFGVGGTDREIGLPELTGEYNQGAVGRAFVAIGQPNPLPSAYQNRRIAWRANGKLQAQGVECSLRKQLWGDWFAGLYAYFLRVDTTAEFFLDQLNSNLPNLSAGDRLLLDRVRRQMNVLAGLTTGDHATQFGFGDLDCYFMWERGWEYLYKFRSIHAQASVGGLFPIAPSRNINEPTSIPLGGEGFWGAYAAVQAEFEVKEDWKVGCFFRGSKRFARTRCVRVPLCDVPVQYSPLVSEVDINPGPTFVFMGWASFENLHKGLGARVLLTVRKHFADDWDIDCCPANASINCNRIQELTQWGSDYITLNVFYDFGKTKVDRGFEPIIFFAWDVPSNMLVTENTAKTNKISLGVELSF